MSATPVLLLHAFPFDSRMWRAEVDLLAPARTVLAPDLRGFGSSRSGTLPETVDQHARDLVAELDAAGIPRAVVVGLSMGGYVALALAQLAPHRLAGLVLADTNAHADSPAVRADRDALADRVRREGVGFLPDVWIPRLVAEGASESVRALLRGLILEQDPRGVMAGLRALGSRPDRTALLATIEVPTMVVCGEHDALSTPETMERMARNIPGAKMRLLEGAGHMSNLEAPEPFAKVLMEALADVDG